MGYRNYLAQCRRWCVQFVATAAAGVQDCGQHLLNWQKHIISGIRIGWHRCTSRIQIICWKYQMVAFLLLFFAIWHPGVHSRYLPTDTDLPVSPSFVIPKRPQIYPVESITVKLSARPKWLSLSMQGKIVVSFPLNDLEVPAGKFLVSQLLPVASNGKVGDLEGPNGNVTIRTNAYAPARFFIEMDDDFWEMVYPYLRISTPVYVE